MASGAGLRAYQTPAASNCQYSSSGGNTCKPRTQPIEARYALLAVKPSCSNPSRARSNEMQPGAVCESRQRHENHGGECDDAGVGDFVVEAGEKVAMRRPDRRDRAQVDQGLANFRRRRNEKAGASQSNSPAIASETMLAARPAYGAKTGPTRA